LSFVTNMKSMRLCATLILSALTVARVGLAIQSNLPPSTAAPPTASAAPTSGPIIQVDNAVYDFGKAEAGEKVRHTYYVTNTGTEPLLITNVHPSCGCTTAGTWTHEIAPGQSGEIPIQFNSSGYGTGNTITKTIEVFSNARNEPRKTLQLKGKVWKAIEVTPSLAVISIPPGTTNEMSATVRIVNQSDNPVTISNAVSTSHLFNVELKETKPGKEYELTVTAHPPYAPGNTPGTINLNTSLSSTPTLSVTAMTQVAPFVQVYPPQIILNTLPDRWTTNRVTIHGNTTDILTLSNPRANDSQIHVEIRPGGLERNFTLLVSFPPGFKVQPGQHAEVTIDSSYPRFPEIKVPIISYPQPAPRPVAAMPAKAYPNQAATAHP